MLDEQAKVIGGAQLAVVRREGDALAAAVETVADLHEDLVAALRRAVDR